MKLDRPPSAGTLIPTGTSPMQPPGSLAPNLDSPGSPELFSRDNKPRALGLGSGVAGMQIGKIPLGTPTTVANSFLDIGKRADEEDGLSENIHPEHDHLDTETYGISFEELVDRLLRQPMSKSDVKFVAIFLCLYRNFAAPAELLSATLRRFEKFGQQDDVQLLRFDGQLRHLAILAQWVAEYPGDFAHPITRAKMDGFLRNTAKNRVFAAATHEMRVQLAAVTEDDDTKWACSDNNRGDEATLASFSNSLLRDKPITNKLNVSDDHVKVAGKVSDIDKSKAFEVSHINVPLLFTNLAQEGWNSTLSATTPLKSVEVAQRQADLLIPVNRTSLTKFQWHQFMDSSEEDIARELTRIDWIMYSAIRPRDLIRHVSLPTDQKARCKGLEHVNRMINHFNHLAFWVANMVLLRDKAKHRAKALEKYIGIAWVCLQSIH